MPVTYATEELRDAFEKETGLPPPDRRLLIYHVVCPMSDDHCFQAECEYGPCQAPDADEAEQEAIIHIAEIPTRNTPHPMAPVDYLHQWLLAAAEATMMLDEERLGELDEIQKQWLAPQHERDALSQLVESMKTMADCANPSMFNECTVCGKQHLLPEGGECPGCRRMMDPDAERIEYPSRSRPAT